MVFYFIVQFVINTLQQLLLSLKLTLGLALHVASQKNTAASWIHLHGRRVFHRGCKSNERGRTGSKRGIYSTFSLTIMFILLVFSTSSKLYFFYLPLFQLIILFPSLLSSNWKYLPSRELVELSGLGECVLKNSIYFNVHLIVSSSLHTVKELAYVVMIFQFLFWYSE